MDLKWLSDQLDLPGRSQAALARKMGLAASGVNKILKGNRRLLAHEAEEIREYLASTQNGANAPPAEGLPTQIARPDDSDSKNTLDVWASTEGGELGAMVITSGPIDRIPRPSGLSYGSFSVYQVGDSMSPAYEHGDMLYVDPKRPPRGGDDCIFVQERSDGSYLALTKRLIRSTAEKWRVRQFNELKDFDLDRRKWSSAWLVKGKMNRG